MFQGGFPQQWQQGFNQAPPRTGPPPAKKVKGNPIITRYPPPPGYRGPAQPQIPYPQQAYQQQPQTWQQPGQPYNYSQPSWPGYAQQGYGVPQAIQTFAQPYANAQPQYQSMQYSATGQVPQTQYSPSSYARSYGAAPAAAWQPPILTPQSAPAHVGPPPDWNTSSTIPQKRRHQSMASLDYSSISMDPIPEHSETNEDLDDDDFTGECYFASHPDEIEEDFSLGWISWKAALPNKRALPSTFAEAELEALAPRKPLPTDDESISDYFIKAKRHEALLSIRQTAYWEDAKDDSLFKELPVTCSDIIPTQQLLSKYKNRPDPAWLARPFTPTPEPEIEANSDAVSGAVDTDGRGQVARRDSVSTVDGETDVLGNLEQALRRNSAAHSRHHSRASSVASVSSQKRTRPEPLMPIRDQAQEDILASLGVTGSPKMVYQTPGPAIGAPPKQEQERLSKLDRDNSRVSTHSIAHAVPPPPPPPPPGHPPAQYDSWRSNGNSHNGDRRGSNASHHTASGSDFDGDHNDTTPRPKLGRIDSRKRGHDSESDTQDERRRQDDDETPKPRRKFSRTNDPWSARRW